MPLVNLFLFVSEFFVWAEAHVESRRVTQAGV